MPCLNYQQLPLNSRYLLYLQTNPNQLVHDSPCSSTLQAIVNILGHIANLHKFAAKNAASSSKDENQSSKNANEASHQLFAFVMEQVCEALDALAPHVNEQTLTPTITWSVAHDDKEKEKDKEKDRKKEKEEMEEATSKMDFHALSWHRQHTIFYFAASIMNLHREAVVAPATTKIAEHVFKYLSMISKLKKEVHEPITAPTATTTPSAGPSATSSMESSVSSSADQKPKYTFPPKVSVFHESYLCTLLFMVNEFLDHATASSFDESEFLHLVVDPSSNSDQVYAGLLAPLSTHRPLLDTCVTLLNHPMSQQSCLANLMQIFAILTRYHPWTQVLIDEGGLSGLLNLPDAAPKPTPLHNAPTQFPTLAPTSSNILSQSALWLVLRHLTTASSNLFAEMCQDIQQVLEEYDSCVGTYVSASKEMLPLVRYMSLAQFIKLFTVVIRRDPAIFLHALNKSTCQIIKVKKIVREEKLNEETKQKYIEEKETW